MAKKKKDDKYHPRSILIDSIPTWSFLGFAAAVIFGLFAIYSVFFYEKMPDFHIRVVSKAPVFSIREDIPNLEIIFENQDIRKAKKGLSLLTVELSNTGNIAVKTGDFDERAPLRLSVSTGNIIRTDVLNASTSYLETVFKDVVADSNSLRFPKFILEPDQFLLFKLLILHNEEDVPSVFASGKIANISHIQVHDTSKMSEDLHRRPSIYDICPRIVAYGIGFCLAATAITFLIRLPSSISRQKRTYIINKFLSNLPVEDIITRSYSSAAEALSGMYIKYGQEIINEFKSIITFFEGDKLHSRDPKTHLERAITTFSDHYWPLYIYELDPETVIKLMKEMIRFMS